MQWCDSTNKSSTKLNAVEIKFDIGNLFTNEENHRGKISLGEFRVTTPENPLLSITSGYKYKESQYLMPTYN